MCRSLFVACLSLLATPALAQSVAWPELAAASHGSAGDGTRDAALVVAVEDYAFAQDIPGAVGNAQAWVSWLRDARGVPTVKTLINAQATREEILLAAEGVAKRVEPGGRLWVVFIGHGAPARKGDDGVLVGVDAQQTATSLEARSVSRAELISRLDTGAQAETVVLLDACFSGKTSGGDLAPGLSPLKVVSAPPSTRLTVLTAAQGDEYAGPLNDGSRPAFSYLVLGALRGWGDKDRDGRVTAGEAVGYAENAVFQTVVGRTQTPALDGPDLEVAPSAGEGGPDLGKLGGVQARTSGAGGAVTVTTTGGGSLSSSDIQALIEAQKQRAALEQREAVLRQRLAGERAAALSSAVEAKQAEAASLWDQMRPLVQAGGPEAARAVQAFVKDWEKAEVIVRDLDGEHRQGVAVPELVEARRVLATLNLPRPTSASALPPPSKKPRSSQISPVTWAGGATALAGAGVLVGGFAGEQILLTELESAERSATSAEASQSYVNTLYTIGYVGLGAGVVLGGTGLLLPTALDGGAGVVWSGRW